MKRKIVTVHTESLRHLTPQVIEVLRVIGEQFEKPSIRQTKAGLTVYIDSPNYSWCKGLA